MMVYAQTRTGPVRSSRFLFRARFRWFLSFACALLLLRYNVLERYVCQTLYRMHLRAVERLRFFILEHHTTTVHTHTHTLSLSLVCRRLGVTTIDSRARFFSLTSTSARRVCGNATRISTPQLPSLRWERVHEWENRRTARNSASAIHPC